MYSPIESTFPRAYCKSLCSLPDLYLVTFSILSLEMGFSHLLRTEAALANFRATFTIPPYVNVAYCYEDIIALEQHPQVVFFPLMSILEGGVRFLVDPLILRKFRFYGLCLNHLYRLHLD